MSRLTALAPLNVPLRNCERLSIGFGDRSSTERDETCGCLLADETPRAAGQVYNITDGRNTTIREFVTHIAEYLGVPRPTRQVPVAVAKAAAVIMESVARAAGAKSPPPLNRSRLRFLYYNQRYSIENARQELGYDPQFSYREGLPPALDWIAATSPSTVERAHAPTKQLQGS